MEHPIIFISNKIVLILILLIGILSFILSLRTKNKHIFFFSLGLLLFSLSEIIITHVPFQKIIYSAPDYAVPYLEWNLVNEMLFLWILESVSLFLSFCSLALLLRHYKFSVYSAGVVWRKRLKPKGKQVSVTWISEAQSRSHLSGAKRR
ncbi:MAG: hypothetical protein LBE32_07050 [Burkholderiales bacterium]|jgi:hypothetical protein|nr:hypothetical protein [Burkholderiales bacterium]